MNFIIELSEFNGCKNIMIIINRLNKGVIFKPCEYINIKIVANKFI